MTAQRQVSRILWYEGISFLAIIVLSWVNELSDMPHLVGGVDYVLNWREGALETLIILLVAIPVMLLTKRLVSRLHYLEGFLRICAWCRKSEHNQEWIPLEEFFELRFLTETSHGMCSACMDEMKAKIKKAAA